MECCGAPKAGAHPIECVEEGGRGGVFPEGSQLGTNRPGLGREGGSRGLGREVEMPLVQVPVK